MKERFPKNFQINDSFKESKILNGLVPLTVSLTLQIRATSKLIPNVCSKFKIEITESFGL
jgi:hypothetical protein